MPAPRLDTSLEALLERIATLAAPCALATIVGTQGSTYRKAGARMLIEADGTLTGLLSGGCLEHDLREHALAVLQTGTPRIVEYDMRRDDDLVFGIGAGCEGAMRVLVEAAGPGTSAARALSCAGATLATGQATALAVVHSGPDTELGTHACPTSADAVSAPELSEACATAVAVGLSTHLRWDNDRTPKEAWIQYLAPAPRILICGAGPDVEPLVRLLRELRFPATLVDHRPAYADAGRFPGATVILGPAATLATHVRLGDYFAAVVMSHHLASDAAYLAVLADSPIEHVGLLGPRPRRERLLAQLGNAALTLAPRLRGPVGLDIGAATPEGIALAIAAELHALAAGRDGGSSTPLRS